MLRTRQGGLGEGPPCEWWAGVVVRSCSSARSPPLYFILELLPGMARSLALRSGSLELVFVVPTLLDFRQYGLGPIKR